VAQTEAAVSISQQLRNLFGIEFFRGMLEHGGYMNTPCENLPYPQSEDCIQPIRLGGLVIILRDLVRERRMRQSVHTAWLTTIRCSVPCAH
jgi:hypothetical protein